MAEAEATGSTEATVVCRINGEAAVASVPVNRLLLDFLRDDRGLLGAKRACDVQVCGACTVLVDDLPVSACSHLAFEIDGREVRTCEGLGRTGQLSAVQAAFIEAGGFQCGYCTPGMLIAVTALLEENAEPTVEEIRHHLDGNLCRCTGYQKILDAVMAASRALKSEREGVIGRGVAGP
jgi:aerobic carbon-monoxide dehydrogenase small subunit